MPATVVFDGDPVADRHGITVNAMRRQMQMVFQDSYSSLNPRMTMAESIAYAPRMHGVPRARRTGARGRPAGPGRAQPPRSTHDAIRTNCPAGSDSA